jgi:hypothetical protein
VFLWFFYVCLWFSIVVQCVSMVLLCFSMVVLCFSMNNGDIGIYSIMLLVLLRLLVNDDFVWDILNV